MIGCEWMDPRHCSKRPKPARGKWKCNEFLMRGRGVACQVSTLGLEKVQKRRPASCPGGPSYRPCAGTLRARICFISFHMGGSPCHYVTPKLVNFSTFPFVSGKYCAESMQRCIVF